MKRRQFAAIALTAILSFSACIPVTGVGIYAAENDASPESAALETVEEGGGDEYIEAGAQAESSLENAEETVDSLSEEYAEQADDGIQEVDALQENAQDSIQDDIPDSAQEDAKDSTQQDFDILSGDDPAETDPAEDTAAMEPVVDTAADAEADTAADTEADAGSSEAAAPDGSGAVQDDLETVFEEDGQQEYDEAQAEEALSYASAEGGTTELYLKKGASKTLRVIADAAEGEVLTYRWYKSGDFELTGNNSNPASYTVENIQSYTEIFCDVIYQSGKTQTVCYSLFVNGVISAWPFGEAPDVNFTNIKTIKGNMAYLIAEIVTDVEDYSIIWYDENGDILQDNYSDEYELSDVQEESTIRCHIADNNNPDNCADVYFYITPVPDPEFSEKEIAGAAVIRVGDSINVDVDPENNGVLFKFIPEKTCAYTITSTFNENSDGNTPKLDIYDSVYNPVSANREDDNSNSQSMFTFLGREEETYYIRARSEYDDSSISYILNLAETADFCAYGINVNREISPGKKVFFEVNAWSPSALHYQWYYRTESEYENAEEASVIEDATGASYAPASPLTGYYTCKVWDDSEHSKDLDFYLLVDNNLEFNEDYTQINCPPGKPAVLTVKVLSGDAEGLQYSWAKYDSINESQIYIEGASGTSYTIPEAVESAQYNGIVTDRYNNIFYVLFDVNVDESLVSLKDAEFTVSAAGLTYNGKEKKPAVTVKYDGKELTAGKDYKVDYENNTNAGTAKVTFIGIGKYWGTVEKTFSIAKAARTLNADDLSVTFAGKKAVRVTGALGKVSFTSGTPAVASVDADGNVTAKKVGSAKITISDAGDRNYLSARKIITVTVVAAALKEGNVTVSAKGLTYNGKERKPSVTVKYAGKTLTVNTDYKVVYKNNKNAGTGSVVVTGLGNYRSTVTKNFSIAKAPQTLTINPVKAVVGKSTQVTVKGAKGTKNFSSANASIASVNSTTGMVRGKKVGTVKMKVTCKATSNYTAASKTFTVIVLPAATSRIIASNLTTGIKVTWNKVAGASGYIVYRNGTKIAVLTGSTKTTYTDTRANTNGAGYIYKVAARAVIGKSTFNSTAYRTLKIYRMARPTLTTLTNSAASKMTIRWGRNLKANGYQIQYTTDNTFKTGVKTIYIKNSATASTLVANLRRTKLYCVRIRAYKTVKPNIYYSAWSIVKKVRITR